MKTNRKGQAAMEFLMTYGWAILIVVIAIAALAAFGVFNRPVQEGCFMESATMACNGPIPAISDSSGDAVIQLALRNGGASRVNVTGITASGEGDCNTLSSTFTVARVPSGAVVDFTNETLARSEAFVLTLTCTGDYVANSDFQDSFTITYNDVDSGLTGLNVRVRAVAKTQ